MKKLLAATALIAAITTVGFAQDSVKIEWPKAAGAKAKHKVQMELSVMGMNAGVTFDLNRNQEKVSPESSSLRVLIENFRVVLNDEEMSPPEAQPLMIDSNADGFPTSIKGGMSEVDMQRMYLAMAFFAPSTELTKDKAWEMDVKSVGDLPAYKVQTTYVGPDKIESETAWKFTTSLKETGKPFKSEGTFWTRKDGTILKFEVKIEGLPIPAAGAEASGTIKATLVP